MGREALRTGGKILTEIAENMSPELSPKDIVSKHVTVSVQYLIGNLRPGGRKQARVVISVTKKRKNAKRARVIKRDFSLFTSVTRQHVGGHIDKQRVRYVFAQDHSNGRAGIRGDG